jgi:hypothetical protein
MNKGDDKITFMQNQIKIVWDKAKKLIVHPIGEWPKIKAEDTSIPDLFTRYAMILAVVPAVSILIGYCIIGDQIPLIGVQRVGIFDGLAAALLSFLLGLGCVYLVGMAINYFAPYFEAKANQSMAMKVAVYSATPFWLASICFIYQPLSFLWVLRFYGFYLCYHGLLNLMETPKDKVLSYLILIGLIVLILMTFIGIMVGRFISHPLIAGV